MVKIIAKMAACLLLVSCQSSQINDSKPQFTSILGIWKIGKGTESSIMIHSPTDTSIVVTWDYSEECTLVEEATENVYTSKNEQCPNETTYKIRYFGSGAGQMDLPFDTTKSITQVSEDTTVEDFVDWRIKYRKFAVWGSNGSLPFEANNSASDNEENKWSLLGAASETDTIEFDKEFKFIAITFSGGMKWNIDRISLGDFTPKNIRSVNLGACIPSSAFRSKDDDVCTVKNFGYLTFENENIEMKIIVVDLK